MNYYFIDTLGDVSDSELCTLDSPPEGLGLKYYRMMKGKPIGGDYPENAVIHMSQKYQGTKLSSLLGNTRSYLIVDGAVKEVIDELCDTEIEYLPFTLYNHKGRAHSSDYCIINPIGTLDCLDHAASEVDYLEGTDRVVSVERAVLDSKKLKNAPHLFRIKEVPEEYVISEDLAQAFTERKFTNIVLNEIEVSANANQR